MKVAIIHDWLVNFGGAERVVEQFLKIYPQAEIFTLVHDKKRMAGHFEGRVIHTSFVQKIPFSTRLYTKFLSLMPRAFESFDLTGFDLVIASSSSCAKGVITSPDTPFLAYVHTPMRYAWDLYFDYYGRSGAVTRFFMRRQIPAIRLWDFVSSQRIDALAANSAYIARRIKKFWNRDSAVINPPVEVERLSPDGRAPDDFYVVFSRFVPYKRVDLAIRACAELGRRLVVIGGGQQEKALKSLAASYRGFDVEFTGRIGDGEVQKKLQRCRAMIFCAEEDFGIIPVEAQACGRPVIAYGRGGSLETVADGETGVFFLEQTAESVKEAVLRFERLEAQGAFVAEKIAARAQKFSAERFRKEFSAFVEEAIGRFGKDFQPSPPNRIFQQR